MTENTLVFETVLNFPLASIFIGYYVIENCCVHFLLGGINRVVAQEHRCYKTKNINAYILVFCLLVPNLFVCQWSTTLRKNTLEVGSPPSVNLLRNSRNEISLQNGDSMYTHNPRNILMRHYLLAKLPPQHPVATKGGKVDGRQPSGGNSFSTMETENNGIWPTVGAEHRPQTFSNRGAPNYNLHVGRQAFTSIQKFFQQVHENLKVLLSEEQKRCGPKSTPHLPVPMNRNI